LLAVHYPSFIGLGIPAILLRRALVILGGASSTHPDREGEEWKDKGRSDSREQNVECGEADGRRNNYDRPRTARERDCGGRK
jgi:hypothetical protein